MSQRDDLTAAEAELARALAALHPARPAIDRDRLLFLAGRAAGRRTARLWQGTSALLAACVVAAVAVLRPTTPAVPRELVAQPGERAIPRDIAHPGEVPLAFAPQAPEGTYVRLRDDVLARGPAALPPMRASRDEPALTLAELQPRPRPEELRGAFWNFLGLGGRANP